MRRLFKSIISNHKATYEEILNRIKDVLYHGQLVSESSSGDIRIITIQYGYLVYHIVYMGRSIVFFECSGLYAFDIIVKSGDLL